MRMISRIDKIGIVQNPKFNTPEWRININELVLSFCSYMREPDANEMGAVLYNDDVDHIIEHIDAGLHEDELHTDVNEVEYQKFILDFFISLKKEIEFHSLDKILFLD
jgi:hypothetical protein